MNCPVCDAFNPLDAPICASCGASLESGGDDQDFSVLPRGTRLQGGSYELLEVLGRGGFGITYRGHDLLSGTDVAIKEFFPFGCVRRGHEARPSHVLNAAEFAHARANFLHEATIALRFRHPHLVAVEAVFEENSTAYIVMELLHGQTLAQLLEKRGALAEVQALSYTEHIARALETMHDAGLLHRDIKPENIMVCAYATSGFDAPLGERAVLLDFGSARAFSPGATKNMTTVLTPGYAPLEQYGQRARYGTFTDLYALGATLYHMLTGTAPPAATDRAAGSDVTPPEIVNPYISRQVSQAVMWALQMRVDERPQSAADWLRALRTGERPAPVEPAPQHAQSTLSAGAGQSTLSANETPIERPRLVPPRPAWMPESPPELREIASPLGATHRVTVWGHNVKWPRRCACCGGASQEFWLLQTREIQWPIPMCVPCRKHCEDAHSFDNLTHGGMAAGFALFMILSLGLEQMKLASSVGMGIIFLLTLLRGGAALWEFGKKRPECCDFRPVEYKGRDGNGYIFEFKNAGFAREFYHLNRDAAQVLENRRAENTTSETPESVAAHETPRAAKSAAPAHEPRRGDRLST